MGKNALKELRATIIKKKFQGESGVADILGMRVNLVNYAETIEAMEFAIKEQRKLTISFINVY
jgi:UDP-N-acetyl-D-mannosaminuronic acid transferase (WecB/TagA/CpsF family)